MWYEGSFRDDKMHGKGEMHWPEDEKVYKGHFENDKREGNGVLTWKDGQVYDGEWSNGRQHGAG